MKPHRVTVPMILRMESLYRAGLGFAAIAAVINLDYGTALSADSVRYRLGRYSDCYKPGGSWKGRRGMAKPGSGGNMPPNSGQRRRRKAA